PPSSTRFPSPTLFRSDPDSEGGRAGPDVAVGGLLHGHRAAQRVDDRPEGGHEPVAGVLDLLPAMTADRPSQGGEVGLADRVERLDRKSTRLNSSHDQI